MEMKTERPYERLIRYTKYETVSEEGTGKSPSTPSQTVFAGALADELRGIGVSDVCVDENGYVYGTVPANVPDWHGRTLALIAHMFTTCA